MSKLDVSSLRDPSGVSTSSMDEYVMIQLVSAEGSSDIASEIRIPSSTTSAQLTELVNSLLDNDEPLPYAFRVEDLGVEESGSLSGVIQTIRERWERSLRKLEDAELHDVASRRARGSGVSDSSESSSIRESESVIRARKELDSLPRPPTSEDIVRVVYMPQSVFRVRPVGRCTSTLSGHAESVLVASFSPDSRRLASGSGDSTVRLWDLMTETPLQEVTGHRSWTQCVSWSPDGVSLASAASDGELGLWRINAETGLVLKRGNSFRGSLVRAHKKFISALAWEPFHLSQPAWMSSSASSDKDMSSSASSSRPSGSSSIAEALSSGNVSEAAMEAWYCAGPRELVLSVSKDGTAKIWNAATGKLYRAISGHQQGITSCRWSGEGLLYTSSQDRTIRMWSSSTGGCIGVLEGHGHWVNTMALSTDYALRTGAFDPQDSDTEILRISAAGIVRDAREASRDLIDSGLDVEDAVSALLEAAQQTYQQAHEKASERYRTALSTSGGEERLVTGSDDFTLYLWKPASSSKPVVRMTGHQQLVNHVCFSPDGRLIASCSFDKSVRIWDGLSGRFLHTLRGHVGAVYQAAWSADSRLLVSASRDSTVKVFDVRGGKLVDDLPGHADEVYAIDWSVDGQRVVSGGKDKRLKLWRH